MSTATRAPVRWDDQVGAFLVSGFAEASAVLRGTGWSSDLARSPLASPELRAMPPGTLLFTDPPEHTRLRRLLGPPFSPRAIAQLRTRVVAIVDAVLDSLADDAGGRAGAGGSASASAGAGVSADDADTGPEIDILADVAYPVPLAMIAELLDVGVEGAELIRDRTPDLVRMLEVDPTADDLTASLAAATEVTMFLTPILLERRTDPGDDFISTLLGSSGEPDGLTLDEVAATCIMLLAAGHETTTNVITNGTLALLSHPEQREHLFADPERAVEELLRLEGAVRLVGRTALVDHELGGERVRAGQAVFVQVYEANRDPARFPDPERLDLSRRPAGHLAFGGGAHFCLGAALARLEVTETLTRLFTRYPDLALTDAPIRRRDSTTFHGLTQLPVRLGRAALG